MSTRHSWKFNKLPLFQSFGPYSMQRITVFKAPRAKIYLSVDVNILTAIPVISLQLNSNLYLTWTYHQTDLTQNVMHCLGYISRMKIIMVRVPISAISFFDSTQKALENRWRHFKLMDHSITIQKVVAQVLHWCPLSGVVQRKYVKGPVIESLKMLWKMFIWVFIYLRKGPYYICVWINKKKYQ